MKIHELNLQLEKLTKLAVEKQAEHENETTETKARQIQLDRTAEEFHALHAERQQLVRQWQDALEGTRKRDEEINAVATQYMDERGAKQAKLEELQAARDALKQANDDTTEVQSKVVLLERQVQARRGDLMGARDRLQEFKDELEVLKNELSSGANALQRKRAENSRLTTELEDRKMALDAIRKKYQAVKRKLETTAGATEKVESSAKAAEAGLANEEVMLKKHEAALAALKESMFKQSQALFALRQEEANLIAEISGAQAQTRNLQGKIRGLDGESMRQQELIYNAEFQIQQMERKVARGLGERSDDEKKKLNAVIAEQEASLEAAREKKKMLTAQCRKLHNELKQAERKQELVVKQRGELGERIGELELENTSAEQSLKSFVEQQQESMVQHDVMRLELKRLRDALNARADEVFSLENRRQQLTLSMDERKREIAVHQEVQRAQMRAAEDERHKAQLEVGARKQTVEKLRAKYETLVKASGVGAAADDGEEGGGGGGGGDQKSQAFYLIQAAQRREELQREGDELDQDIRKREKEIRALEHTLEHLNLRNVEFRRSFAKADMNSSEADDLSQLEEQAKLAQDALFRRKKELQRLQTDYEEDQRRLEQVAQQGARLEERNAHLGEAKTQMEAELAAQADALDKAARRLERLSVAHRDKLGGGAEAGVETLYEKDFRLEAARDTSQNVLFTLGELAKAYPEIKDVLDTQLRTSKLTLPARPASRPGGGGGGRAVPEPDAASEISMGSRGNL